MEQKQHVLSKRTDGFERQGEAVRVTKSRLRELRTSLPIVHAALIPGITISRRRCGQEGLAQIVCKWPAAWGGWRDLNPWTSRPIVLSFENFTTSALHLTML
jgi:hypothetical protein